MIQNFIGKLKYTMILLTLVLFVRKSRLTISNQSKIIFEWLRINSRNWKQNPNYQFQFLCLINIVEHVASFPHLSFMSSLHSQHAKLFHCPREISEEQVVIQGILIHDSYSSWILH